MVETNRQTSDLIEEVLEKEGEDQAVTTDLQFMDSSVISIAPGPDSLSDYVIDDPVTGAGNEDLWIKDESAVDDNVGEEETDPAPSPDSS